MEFEATQEAAIPSLERLAEEYRRWCADRCLRPVVRVEPETTPYPTLVASAGDSTVNVIAGPRYLWWAAGIGYGLFLGRHRVLAEVSKPGEGAARLGDLLTGIQKGVKR